MERVDLKLGVFIDDLVVSLRRDKIVRVQLSLFGLGYEFRTYVRWPEVRWCGPISTEPLL